MPSHLKRHDEPGYVHFWTLSCYRRLAFFWHDGMKQVAIDAMTMLRARFGVCLIGYVVMPDHVHLLLYPHAKHGEEPISISVLLHAFKQHVGFHGKQRLREIWSADRGLWSEPLNRWARGELPKQIVMATRGYDFCVDRERTLIEKINYCHKNPVTRGLVDHPSDWHWSSFRFYDEDGAGLLAMDWDGVWPIVW